MNPLFRPIDGDLHQSQQRMARSLDIDRENLAAVAAGKEDVRTDHLGGIAAADPQQFRRRRIEPDPEPDKAGDNDTDEDFHEPDQ